MTVESVRTGITQEAPEISPSSVPLSVPQFVHFTSHPGVSTASQKIAVPPSVPAVFTPAPLSDPLRVFGFRLSQMELENQRLRMDMAALQQRVTDQAALLMDLALVILVNCEDLNRLKERVSTVKNQVQPTTESDSPNFLLRTRATPNVLREASIHASTLHQGSNESETVLGTRV